MSKLIVEVCRVDKIEPHPNGDRLRIATVKGWKTCIGYNPETGVCQFKEGDKCVFFPPDSVLPPSMCNGPADNPPGRLNNIKYLHQLPKDELGVRPAGGRVVACRLRGHVSYGVIMAIDPTCGDNPNWAVGTDVAEHFGITKWEPPQESNEGDAERPNSRFHRYTDIENFGNYPNAIADGTDVVITEKIHGKNCRIGLVLENDDEGHAEWTWMAGSHDVRRKEWSRVETRFKMDELVEEKIFSESLPLGDPAIEIVFIKNGRCWKIENIFEQLTKSAIFDHATQQVTGFEEKLITKVHCFEVRRDNEKFEAVFKRSEFWEMITPSIINMMGFIQDEFSYPEPKHGIVLYGELFGSGSGQDMNYGLKGKSFIAFDLSINGQYVDYEVKSELFLRFGVPMVPIIYRGPFSVAILEEHTSGPTTLCDIKDAGPFKGREGIVVTPTKELHYSPILNGRQIVKSVSADYHARKNGTEFH